MRYNELSRQLRVMAGRKRLEILKILCDSKERTVGDIADTIRLSLKSTSKHLQILAAAGFVEARRDRNVVYYRLHTIPSYLVSLMKIIRVCHT